MITDDWQGIEMFFSPRFEILVAQSAERIVELLRNLTREDAIRIGGAMRERALGQHTYASRARLVDGILRLARAEAEAA